MDASGFRASDGAELALTMADACADCGELRQALAHLDALRGAREHVPEEYESKRVDWTRRLRAAHDTSPRDGRRSFRIGAMA
jgi:hypothetical protein